MTPPRDWTERFWAKVQRSEGCWTWTAKRNNSGYGQLGMGQRGHHQLAHRLSYQLAFGAIPKGMNVCHRCDNPACVRPDHLFLGTQSDNMRDAFREGRGRNTLVDANRVKTHCMNGHPFDDTNTGRDWRSDRFCIICQRAYYQRRYRERVIQPRK